MQLYEYICEQLQFFPLDVQYQQYQSKSSREVSDEKMKQMILSTTLEPFVCATLGFTGNKSDRVHYTEIDDQEAIILKFLDNLIQDFFQTSPLIKNVYEKVLTEIQNNDLQSKIEVFRQDPTNQIKIILQLLILYIEQEKQIEPTLFECFLEIILGYNRRFLKKQIFSSENSARNIIESIIEEPENIETNNLEKLPNELGRYLKLFVLAFFPSKKEKKSINKINLIEILSFILNKYDVNNDDKHVILDYIVHTQKKFQNGISDEMRVLYGFYLLFVSDLKFSSTQINKYCQYIREQYSQAQKVHSFHNTTQANYHSLLHLMNTISFSWSEVFNIEDDAEESEEEEERGVNIRTSFLKLKNRDLSNIVNLDRVQNTEKHDDTAKKHVRTSVTVPLENDEQQDSTKSNLIETAVTSTSKSHSPPKLQYLFMYDSPERKQSIIQHLQKRRQEIEGDLNRLCEWFQNPMKFINKMAFVKESRAIRKLPEEQYQGFLVLSPECFDPGSDVWFVGDIHGDLLGLYAVLDAIKEKSKGKKYRVVFLGDLVDDGHDMIHVVYEIAKKIHDEPNTYCWLAGNHDEGTIFDAYSDKFISTVSPARFADWLNQNMHKDLGLAFIELVKKLPRAIFFPKGLMCSHAGIPHSDVVNNESFVELSDMDQNQDIAALSMQDFAWTRLNNVRKRRVNRVRKTCSFGYKNFEEFSQKLDALGLKELTKASIRYFVRGHDHCEDFHERWDRFSHKPKYWQERALTINNMCFDMRDTQHVASLGYVRAPVIAKWNSNPTETPYPEPFALDIPESLVHTYAPLCSKNNHINLPSHNSRYVNSMDTKFCEGFVIDLDTGEKVQCKEPIITQNHNL